MLFDEFKTEVELEYEGPEGSSVPHSKVTIYWNMELEFRIWGVKSFIVIVQEQPINFHVSVENSETDETKEITAVVNDVKINLDDARFEKGFAPAILEYYKGNWRLVF
jgi:hypothetical protein